jgi:hypothetical protein
MIFFFAQNNRHLERLKLRASVPHSVLLHSELYMTYLFGGYRRGGKNSKYFNHKLKNIPDQQSNTFPPES